MALPIRPFVPAHNADILNAIRNEATNDYQRRIPAATKANVADSINALMTNTPGRNEFINALVNRIGMVIAKNNSWTNPLAKFKRGMLEYGDTIEEIQVGLAQAYVYDIDREYLERDIFGQERPEVQTSFHKVNRENYYKITVNEGNLHRAFVNPMGLSSFISQLMDSPMTSDNWDEFLLTTSLFKAYDDAGGFFKSNVPDISSSVSVAGDSRIFLRKIREFADNMTFLSRHYNAAKMPVSAAREDLELFITPEANAAIDVEALAAAFNIERAAIPSRTTVIPKEHFGIDGAQAVLTTRDFFVIADNRFETTEAVNPVGLHTNYFLHHHQVVSSSRFVPAILFTTGAGDTITILDTPVVDLPEFVITDSSDDVVATMARGGLYTVTGSAVTDPAGGVNDAIRFRLVGAESDQSYLSQTGILHVAINETATALTVEAWSTEDDTVNRTLEVAIDAVPAAVVFWPHNAETPADNSQDL